MILIELTAGGVSSLGYTYGHAAIASVAKTLLEAHVIGQNPLDVSAIWAKLNRAIRNDGKTGLAAMAIAAIDIALWDLKAKLLNISLAELFGMCRQKVEVYGSGGFTSYSAQEMAVQMRPWSDQGLRHFKMKVGRNPADDPARVAFVRECIGREATLMVDANEAYDIPTALLMAQHFEKQKVTWFEQPINSQDLPGMKELKEKLPAGMALTDGEYIYNIEHVLRLIQFRCADVIQLDVTRCQGMTGFLKAAALCEAANIPVSSHCAPSLHVALGCALPHMLHLEYFYDHVRIEEEFFEGVLPAQNGFLEPDLSRPGLGLKLKSHHAERFRR